jgi:beta-galactosidase
MRIYLNSDWIFTDGEGRTEMVRLPHTNQEIPYDYFDEKDYQMVCTYKRKLDIPAEWQGKHLLLTVEAAGHYAKLFLNGKLLTEHKNGYTAFTVDLAPAADFGGENLLTIELDNRESLDQPPFGYVIDYLCYGGLYREVYLDVKESEYIADVFAMPKAAISQQALAKFYGEKGKLAGLADGILTDAPGRLESEIKIAGSFEGDGWSIRQTLFLEDCGSICGALNAGAGKDAAAPEKTPAIGCSADPFIIEKPINFKGEGASYTLRLSQSFRSVQLWDVESPALYTLKTELLKDGEPVDERTDTIGFRSSQFRSDGYYLNGRKLRLRGLDRHQAYPYVGYAMPKNIQIEDARILKEELGLNAVRTSHYPQSQHFIDACDRLGLLVFTEIPGWQHIGGDDWKMVALKNTEEMVLQYRNHPSIILWGVRINESQDCDGLYRSTNEAAHRLDPTRPTSGVRYLKKSSLLEDVYAYNDFVHDGTNDGVTPRKDVTPDLSKGYLISEYNGHMFPTKMFDDEWHRRDHLVRHARVLNDAAAQEDIAGSFGWCFADYNTHSDFGSGDRICYHGVMDMYRNPKPAAHVYSALQDETPVLFVSSSMDIGEHPASNIGKTYIVSNADSVRMYQNGVLIHEYTPEDSEFEKLTHGPIMISDYIGKRLEEGEDFSPKEAELCRDILNYAAIHGFSKLPPRIMAKAGQVMLRYGLKYQDAYQLYGKYVQGWGDSHKEYKFEAVKDGQVVETVVKSASNSRHLDCDVSAPMDEDGCFILKEENSYDAAAIRVTMQDQNGNQLFFLNESVVLEAEGPIEIIGPEIMQLRGGAGGTYIRTTGESGKATLTLRAAAASPVVISFDIKA